jgi:predicted ribosomally synthesized peptide with nif11-like leader
MSEEQLKAFLEKVKADTSLQEKLKAAADAEAVAAIAKEAGFSISADYLTKAQSELSDEELEGVAGGGPNGGCPPWFFKLLGFMQG